MQTFETPAAISTVLDIPAGTVRFVAADRTETTVEVRPANPAKSRDVKATEETKVEYAEGVLRIEAPTKTQILGSSGTVEVTVQLPAGSQVAAKAASAELTAAGRFGDFTVESSHGAIEIEEAANVRLTTQAGDITVGRLTGAGELSTAKGDLRITEAVSGKIVLTTQAGDITVGAATGVSASLDAGTTLGRIQNSLKNADGVAALQIHATTSHGDISAHSL
ncbi:putative adhesin [Kribbella amoyensis]|uniref:Putative adhesin n=1 Tax=Kribbella amoyensis TaxID=996641 RepID=A0A561BL80_9ACTN|nr:DUF4097 family beta strand repeat-containing protein [Kribbella amoyensis]TWD79598.1 putative adhesin [Kribbella amoyensis]